MNGIGFFGKLPATGDFVARGLEPGLRPFLDQWLTGNFAQRAQTPDDWPENGYRAIVKWNKIWLVLLILPSNDKAGRKFPLAVCRTTHSAPDRQSADRWCDAIHFQAQKAIADGINANDLITAFTGMPLPDINPDKNAKQEQIWP
ncbi:MAG TPA: type VI secretion system-associated protein TagF [Rhodobacteraceae bacterium]|nr:type VI secretion system-associated protein TagF [Paracoccaceae bacterium]